MEINPAPLNTAEVIEGLERSFRPVAKEKGLELVLEIAADVPEIVSDDQRVAQILRNLLSNAVKFTDSGSVKLALDPTTEIDHHGARYALAFTVTDTGIGIPQDKLRLIFEAFQQADGTTSRHYGGTGLGLSISRELTRLLGGELRLSSVPGEGSTFTLVLPLADQRAAVSAR
jgi:signal transduction histidine kinase